MAPRPPDALDGGPVPLAPLRDAARSALVDLLDAVRGGRRANSGAASVGGRRRGEAGVGALTATPLLSLCLVSRPAASRW